MNIDDRLTDMHIRCGSDWGAEDSEIKQLIRDVLEEVKPERNGYGSASRNIRDKTIDEIEAKIKELGLSKSIDPYESEEFKQHYLGEDKPGY